MAVVSVPGPYAALAAHCALTAGLHVLLFSDNVPVSDEVALKRRASGLGGLVMGPGAGTAMLGGVGPGLRQRGRRRAGGRGRRRGHRRAGGHDAARPLGHRRVPGHRRGRPGPVGRGGRADGARCRPGARRGSRHRGHPAGLQAARPGRGPDGDRREPGHPGGRGLPGHVRPGRRAGGRLAGHHARKRRAAGRRDPRPGRAGPQPESRRRGRGRDRRGSGPAAPRYAASSPAARCATRPR